MLSRTVRSLAAVLFITSSAGIAQSAIIVGDPDFDIAPASDPTISNSDTKQIWIAGGSSSWTQGVDLGPSGTGDFAAIASTASTLRSVGQIVESGVPAAAGSHTFSFDYYQYNGYSASTVRLYIQVYGMTSTTWGGSFKMDNNADASPVATTLLNLTNVSAGLLV